MQIQLPHNFIPRHYQRPLFVARENNVRRACLVFHRRAGKDVTALNLTILEMVKRVGSYFYFLPTFTQGKKVIWDGINKEGMPFLDYFPKELIRGEPNNTEMKIRFRNGSLFQIVGSDNYNNVMGTNPFGIIFSEYSLSNPLAWDYFRPILAENGGWAIFLFTPRGRNFAHEMYEMALQDPEWFCSLLTVDDTRRNDGTPVITREAIESEIRQGMSKELAQQEFWCSFDAVGSQAFEFGKQHIIPSSTPIPEYAPLYMTFDWGFGAPFSIQWWYVDADNRLFHFKEYYGWSGIPNEGLRLTDEEIARSVIEIEKSLGISDKPITRLAGPDCFAKFADRRGGGQGPSTAEVFERYNLKLIPGDPSRELKIRQFRSRLHTPEDGTRPMLQVYDSCTNFIRTIPLIPVDKNNIEYIDTTSENHTFDAACHICMARPAGHSSEYVQSEIDKLKKEETMKKLDNVSRLAWSEYDETMKEVKDQEQYEKEGMY